MSEVLKNLSSPKRRVGQASFRDAWYPYYAGFSPEFVESIVIRYPRDLRVCDPWNGSGTTTLVSSLYQMRPSGFDINPAMTIVAKARMLSKRDVVRAKAVALDTVANYKGFESYDSSILENWFTQDSCRLVSRFISSISFASGFSLQSIKNGSIDCATSALILGVFKIVKSYSDSMRSSNPTWIKQKLEEAVEIDERRFVDEFINYASSVTAESHLFKMEADATTIMTMDTTLSMPYIKHFDVVIGSPPYATRIDYAVQTALELGIIGYSKADFRLLRNNSLGTTTVNISSTKEGLTDYPYKLLERIRSHSSKASSSYYHKTYLDYFVKLNRSIKGVIEATNTGGDIYFVVQDSHYKDIYIDLARTVDEIFEANGVDLIGRRNFSGSASMKSVNTSSKKYRTSYSPIESVIQGRIR